MNTALSAIVSASLLLLTPLLATAENSTQASGLHCPINAFPAAILTPDIAG